MASLSLPRVLQLKKNHLDAERENFEKFQSLAISKAINSQETPVKEKHVRSTIIGSFQEQGAVTYWVVAIRLPLQDNRIVSWKFCHVTHKLLREGHPACLDDSQRHIGMIENLGKLWVHLREGYGKLIKLYTTLLAGKLRFHQRNPQFPGNMAVSAEELDAIAENDVNNYFQLCVELFDYMDDILNLQAAVFDSLGNARANSMTASGQCRLAALIPCAQDSSHIYDCNVRLLFRLHAALPADVLAGHRERFRQQFKKLSAFYKHASTMQYFRNLLTLPQLPSNPPNFLIQSDFGTYVAPVVMIPEQEPEPEQDTVGSLIDTSDTMSQMTIPDTADFVDSRTSPSPQPDLVLERDRLIDHLQAELRRQRTELAHMADERSGMLVSMRDHCSKLEAELADAKSSLQQERAKAELLSAQTPEITQKLNEVEERAKLTDDKFQKLKGAYTQLRSEHIGLIRQKAEVDKVAASLRTVAAEHESAKTALQEELSVRSRDVEQLQQSASNNEAINTELEILRNEIISLRFDLDKSREKEKELEELKRSIEETRQQHRAKTLEAQEHILRIEEKTKELADELESTKQEKFENEKEFYNLREENMNLKTKRGDELSKALEEKKEVEKQVANLMQQFQQEKQELENHIYSLENTIKQSEQQETSFKENIEILQNEIDAKKKELEKNIHDKEIELTELTETVLKLTNHLKEKDQHYENNLLKNQKETEYLQKELQKSLETSELSHNDLLKKFEEIENLKELLEKSSEKEITKGEEIEHLKELISKSAEECEFSQKQLLIKDEEINNFKELLKKSAEECDFSQKALGLKQEEVENLKELLNKSSEEFHASQKQLLLKDEELENLKELSKESTDQIEAFQKDLLLNNSEIDNLKDLLNKSTDKCENLQRELFLSSEEIENFKEHLNKSSTESEFALLSKDAEIETLKELLNKSSDEYDIAQKEILLKDQEVNNFEEMFRKSKEENEKLQNTILLKDKEVQSIKIALKELSDEKENECDMLKNNLSIKETQVNDLNSQIDKLNEDLESIANEIEEREAELEITKNEFLSLKTNHLEYVKSSETNIDNGSKLLEKYEKEVRSLGSDKQDLLSQIAILNVQSERKDKDYDENISSLQNSLEKLQGEYESTRTEDTKTVAKLSEQLETVTTERDEVKKQMADEILNLEAKIHDCTTKHTSDKEMFEKNLSDSKIENENLNLKVEELAKQLWENIESRDALLKQSEEANEQLENKLEYSEKKRLTAEGELQDLLQHNTVLEENLGAVKIQLLQAQQELEKSRASLVQTAALTGVELLQQALAELEVKSAHESSAAAADRAANALHHLTAQQVEGEATEADVARSATRAAHHAVKLATHTADLLSTVTDNQLIDSVTGDTRTMLGLTKQCMEELARGDPSDKAQARARAEEARARVAALAERTASAVQAKGSVRTVDDELADMDAAIEEAAGRIEEMLAASRAADSGVKLEVNNKILDACTTLMGAVKVLVQDARKLQNELGDPKTRLKMYRRNPQWSEGLISAAKAVVVAAKLLVSSADEAVCGAGAIEGVSAASHEVAGSTAQLVAASRARAPPASPALAALSQASRNVAAATGAVVAAVRAVSALTRDNDDLETSALTLTATRRLEMESKVRSLELECALDAERARLAALRRRHYQLAQQEENGNITNGGH